MKENKKGKIFIGDLFLNSFEITIVFVILFLFGLLQSFDER